MFFHMDYLELHMVLHMIFAVVLRRDSEPDTPSPTTSDDEFANIPPELFERASDSDRSEPPVPEDYCWRFLDKVNGKTYETQRQAFRRIEHLHKAFNNDGVTCEDIKHVRKTYIIVYTDFAGFKHRATIYYIG